MNSLCKLHLYAIIFTVVVLGSFSGCSPRDTSLGKTVRGTVTFVGEPIPEGRIVFLDKATNEPVSTSIRKGSYEIHLLPGEKVVKISADKVVGKRLRDSKDPNSGEFEVYEQYLPKKYNDKTTLTFTMSDKAETKNFELTAD